MAKRTDKEYEERYQALLKEHGLERKQSDFEKDIAEYRAKTEDKGTPKHGTQPGEEKDDDEITVRTTKAGAATAEVNTEAVNKNKKAKEVKKQSVTDKKAPSTTPVEAPKTKKRISNTSEKAPTASAEKPNTTPPQDKGAIAEYYKTAGANKEAQGYKRAIKRGGANYGKLKISAAKRLQDMDKSVESFKAKRRGLTIQDIADANKKRQPRKHVFSPAKITTSSLRDEYQQELIKKHKKEMSK